MSEIQEPETVREYIICENPNKALPFYVTELGMSGSGFDHPPQDGYMLIFMRYGSGLFRAGDTPFAVHKENMALIDCAHGICCTSGDETECCFVWMQLGGSGTEAYAALGGDDQPGGIPIYFRTSLLDDIRYISLMAKRTDLISMVQISNTLSEILSTLLTQKLSAQLSASRLSSHHNDIHSAVEYIRANYNKDIGLKDITAHVNISKFYFIRLFKEQIGMTPYEYLISYRIYRAKLLLRSTAESVNKISASVGFSSPSNFIRHFRRSEGASPAGYRRRFERI